MVTPFAGQRVLLFEGEAAEPLAADRRRELVTALLEAGYDVRLTGIGVDAGPLAAHLNGDCVAALGQFNADHEPNGPPPRLDLRGRTPAEIVDRLKEITANEEPAAKGRWLPWFPVIDVDRCTNCLQCLNFCLFGVYDKSTDGKLVVANPAGCKTNCPACSRVCPEVAIMFPKYRHGPINGEDVKPEDLEREHMKVDVSALLGGDIYKLLRERSVRFKSRFAAERDEQKALRERIRCLKKEGVKVPDDMLQALDQLPADTLSPSGGERL